MRTGGQQNSNQAHAPLWPYPNWNQHSYTTASSPSSYQSSRLPADQLQRAVERNEYGEAAHLIEAVQQLAGHFQSFVAIPKVAELSGRVATLQRAIQVTSRADRMHDGVPVMQ
jgi:hypothetical protein